MQHWKTALLSCLITINLATVSSFFVVFFCAQLSHNLSDNNNVSSSFFYLVYIDWVHPFSWSIVVMIHSLKHVDCVNVCSRAPTHTVKTRHWCSIHLIKSMAKNYCLSFQFDWFYFFFLGDGQWENGKERRPTAGEVTPARHNGAGEKKNQHFGGELWNSSSLLWFGVRLPDANQVIIVRVFLGVYLDFVAEPPRTPRSRTTQNGSIFIANFAVFLCVFAERLYVHQRLRTKMSVSTLGELWRNAAARFSIREFDDRDHSAMIEKKPYGYVASL